MSGEQTLKDELRRLKAEDFKAEYKEKITEFVEELQLSSITAIRRANYIQRLRIVANL